jgi:hypothetical protein
VLLLQLQGGTSRNKGSKGGGGGTGPLQQVSLSRGRLRREMAASQLRLALGALMLLGLVQSAAAVEVCKVVDLQLVTQTGEFFLAVTFLGMGVATVIFVLMAFKAAHEKRKFYFTTCYIGAISTFAYYAMLSGQGWLITPSCRQLFYVRCAHAHPSLPVLPTSLLQACALCIVCMPGFHFAT